VSLKEKGVCLILILILLGLVTFFFYPVFEGWKPGKWEYSRGEREEYTLGVWITKEKLMTLIGQYGQLNRVNFAGIDPPPVVLAYKKRLGISWSKITSSDQKDKWVDALCPMDRVMVIGEGGLDNFDKIINFGGGECGGKK
jgi:hypothetical protein